MTILQFKQIRQLLGLTQSEMATALRLNSGRAIRAYELKERRISGPVSKLMEIFIRDPDLMD